MDPISIGLLIGVATLIIERVFTLLNRLTTSKCCGSEIDFKESSPLVYNGQERFSKKS